MTLTRSTVLRAGLAAAAILAFGGPVLAEGKTYVFATEAAYPPFNMSKPDGTIYGFEVDLLAEAAKRAGIEYDLISQAWDGMIQGLVDGKYDGVIDAVTVTEKRLQVVDFSLPYTTGGSTFAVLKDAGIEIPGADSLVVLDDETAAEASIAAVAEALKGKTVGVQVSTIQADFLEKYLAPRGVTIRTYPNGPDVYQDLMNGRLDATMAAITNISAFLEKNGDEATTAGPNFTGGVMGRGAAIAVQKGDAELAEKLGAALKSMSEDGTLEALSMKYFKMNVTPKL
ncbi:transporter substrate-binding domain-containing protein [Frigidibacter sp. MR17.24]|uniref:transporter substrate-binding domain-containing protein n=1 Tax=Frigidibacter sp. MR17.24 TaxID=3127345 RepID=UPI003012E951